MKSYYYVNRAGCVNPAVKHATLELAVAESKRLAAKHPGVAFEILQCLGISQTVSVNTFWLDAPETPRTPSRDCPGSTVKRTIEDGD